MNTNKKNNTILFTIFGIVLVIVVGLLVFFANRPKTTDNTASSTSTSSSQKVDYPTNYKLHDAVKNSTTALNDLTLPQLSTTVAEDEAEVEIKTTAGNINIKLFPKLAPNAVQNFLVLAKNGYYKNNEFFRVIKDFMIDHFGIILGKLFFDHRRKCIFNSLMIHFISGRDDSYFFLVKFLQFENRTIRTYCSRLVHFFFLNNKWNNTCSCKFVTLFYRGISMTACNHHLAERIYFL